MMPALFHHLPPEELGVWLLLGQSWAVMGIFDLGFGFTLTRRIAMAKGKSGGDPNSALTEETLNEIADLVACGRRIYRIMAGGVFLVTWTLGFFYLRNLDFHGLNHATVWTAWTVLCASQGLSVWASVWTCLLQGVGYVGWDALFGSIINATMLISQIIAVLCGGGLVSLSIIAALSSLIQRGVIRTFALRRRPELFALRGRWNPALVRGMVGISIRSWLTAVGGALVYNSDGFFIASSQGAENIPAFRAAFIVVLNVHMLAGVFASSSFVFISHLWQAGQIAEVQRILRRNFHLGMSIMVCGSAAILAAGDSLFNLWLGHGNYVGLLIMAIFTAMFILEQQTFIISIACRATEQESFGGWMMASGLLKFLLAFLLMRLFGLAGLAAATLLAQLLTAHWFAPYHSFRRLQISLRSYLAHMAGPCAVVFTAALCVSYTAVTLLKEESDWIKLILASLGSGTVLIVALWRLVLDPNQQARIINYLQLRLRLS